MAERTRGNEAGLREVPLSGGSIRESERRILNSADSIRQWLSERQMPVPPSLRVVDSSAERAVVSRFYSGSAIGKVFDAAPPTIVSVSREDFLSSFAPQPTVDGQMPDAIYVPGTNLIVIAADALSRYRPEAVSEIMYHEMIHYAGFIGRGGEAFTYMGRSRFDPGSIVPFSIEAHWFEEGLTNFFSARLGRSPALSYPYETMLVRMLEMLGADRAMLVDAHAGDTAGLQELVDRRLGGGTFEGLLHCANGMEAMLYLLDKDERGTVFNRLAILDDSLMQEFFNPGTVLLGPTDPRPGSVNSPLERIRRE